MATEALCIALAALAASIASFGLYVTLERRLRKTIRIVESLSADHAREIKLREDERVEVRVSASTVGASSLLEHSSGGPPRVSFTRLSAFASRTRGNDRSRSKRCAPRRSTAHGSA
jgi:hypothetical protein